MRETVYLNSYGDTAEVFRGTSAGYQEYLAARCDAHVQLWLLKHL
jgi:hypothetical protein